MVWNDFTISICFARVSFHEWSYSCFWTRAFCLQSSYGHRRQNKNVCPNSAHCRLVVFPSSLAVASAGARASRRKSDDELTLRILHASSDSPMNYFGLVLQCFARRFNALNSPKGLPYLLISRQMIKQPEYDSLIVLMLMVKMCPCMWAV